MIYRAADPTRLAGPPAPFQIRGFAKLGFRPHDVLRVLIPLPAEKGRDLLKQVRTHLIETARPLMEAMVQEIAGVKAVSLHHDISTVTGEEVILFTLARAPAFREAKKKS